MLSVLLDFVGSGFLGKISDLCGIIGYLGPDSAAPILLNALKRMEYRGYDSAGICTFDDKFIIKKGVGRIAELDSNMNFRQMEGTIGIGHTRWATHGGVTESNAHPHWSCEGDIVVVHNGIIENYVELREYLLENGHNLRSQTDTETICHLLEDYYSTKKYDIKNAILSTVNSLKGSYAFLALVKDHGRMIIGVRKEAPLILGVGNKELFLASDVLGFIDRTNQAVFLDNKEFVIVTDSGYSIYDFTGKPIQKIPTRLAWEISDVSKKEYLHYTLKEIHEQPNVIRAAMAQQHEELNKFIDILLSAKRIYLTGCGTSFHAGMSMKYLLAKTLKLPSEVFISSEIGQHVDLIDSDSVVVAYTQSGETADVLGAIRSSKEQGAKILSIVNAYGSSVTRESDATLYIKAGPEVGVAATKTFINQLVLNHLICYTASENGVVLKALAQIPEKIHTELALEEKIASLSKKYVHSPDYYFVGRGDHFPLALEGALKLKELSYVHAEGIAAGELKHGSLALIDKGTPIVLLNPEDKTYHETLSNGAEMSARGAKIIGISTRNSTLYDEYIPLPQVNFPALYPILEAIPLQMLAYYTAVSRNLDPDYPRNLAKSVTVI
jgi:glucosamine--fructose-6-phosphate aminotransferase (isomerizing)